MCGGIYIKLCECWILLDDKNMQWIIEASEGRGKLSKK